MTTATFADARTFSLADGRSVQVRRVVPADAPRLQAFFAALSTASRRCRFHGASNGISAERAAALARVDAERDAAFVALDDQGAVVAEARWSRSGGGEAEFAIAVGDGWTGQGLARRLVTLLASSARAAGLWRLRGDVLDGNARMLALMERCGFVLQPHPEAAGLLLAELAVAPPVVADTGWPGALAALLRW